MAAAVGGVPLTTAGWGFQEIYGGELGRQGVGGIVALVVLWLAQSLLVAAVLRLNSEPAAPWPFTAPLPRLAYQCGWAAPAALAIVGGGIAAVLTEAPLFASSVGWGAMVMTLSAMMAGALVWRLSNRFQHYLLPREKTLLSPGRLQWGWRGLEKGFHLGRRGVVNFAAIFEDETAVWWAAMVVLLVGVILG